MMTLVSRGEATLDLEENEKTYDPGNSDLPIDDEHSPLRATNTSSAAAGSESDATLKQRTRMSVRKILSQEPHFDLGVPESGRWTCNLCQEDFPLFEVSVGNHIYHCIQTKHGVSLDDSTNEIDNGPKDTEDKLPPRRDTGSKTPKAKPRKRNGVKFRPRKWKCKCCGQRFPSRAGLNRHEFIHSPNLQQNCQCPECKNIFQDKCTLEVHLRRCKRATVKVKSEAAAAAIPVETLVLEELPSSKSKSPLISPSKSELGSHLNRCVVCYAEFSSKTMLNKHRKLHPPNVNSFPCPVCKKVLSTKTILKKHIGMCISSIRQDSLNGDKRCTICSKTFSNKYILQYHYKRHYAHLTESVPKCTICGKVFYSKTGLLTHVAHCDKNKVLPQPLPLPAVKPRRGTCKICHKAVENIQKHMNVHFKSQGSPSHFCKKCPARYTRPESLRKHIQRSHGSELEKKTSMGRGRGKSSNLKESRNSSSTSPSSKKPLIGSGKGTASKVKESRNSSSASLSKAHPTLTTRDEGIAVAVTQQTVKCGTCSKEFPTDRERKAHEFIHKLQRPFKCSHCGREFSLKMNMTKHVAAAHGQDRKAK